MKTYRLILTAIFLAAMALSSCQKDEHVPSVVPVKQTYWNLSVADIPAFAAGLDTTVSVAIDADSFFILSRYPDNKPFATVFDMILVIII